MASLEHNADTFHASLTLLKEQFGYRSVRFDNSIMRDRAFDAILVADDLLPILVLQDCTSPDSRRLLQFSRVLESFAWDLHAQKKRHSLSALVIVSIASSAELAKISRRLNGLCRTLFVRNGIKEHELQQQLQILGKPAIVTKSLAPEYRNSAAFYMTPLEDILNGLDNKSISVLLDLMKRSGSPKEFTEHVTRHYEEIVNQIYDAIKDVDSQ